MKLIPSSFPVGGKCKIAIVGEAGGVDEMRLGAPFVGKSGGLLTKMLKDAGVSRAKCLITNVFRYHPRDNNLQQFFIKRQDAKKGKWDVECPYPAFGSRGFVDPDMVSEIERLKEELQKVSPNIVLAFGATALWALTGRDKIGTYRGFVMDSTLLPGVKVLPTYHPAFILRKWSFLPTVMSDIKKAVEESHTKTFHPKKREIWIEPSIPDIKRFITQYIEPLSYGDREDVLAFDIETDSDKQITCIGFAPSPEKAIVIPIWANGRRDFSYWDEEDERAVWELVAGVLEDRRIPKVAQNGAYDVAYLLRWGIKVRGTVHDTMLLHHTLQPELPKSLDYLASIYLNERPWKTMVSFKKTENKDEA